MQSSIDDQDESRRGDSANASAAAQWATSGVQPVVVALLMAVCLAIGMILGALLQKRAGPPDRPEPAAHGPQTPG